MTSTIGAPPEPRAFTYHPVDPEAVAAGYEQLAALIRAGACPIPLGPAVHLSAYDEEQAAQLRAAFGGGHWPSETLVGDFGTVWRIYRGMCGGLPIEQWMVERTSTAVAR